MLAAAAAPKLLVLLLMSWSSWDMCTTTITYYYYYYYYYYFNKKLNTSVSTFVEKVTAYQRVNTSPRMIIKIKQRLARFPLGM